MRVCRPQLRIRFSRSIRRRRLQEDVLGRDDRGAAVLFENGEDVLEEVEL
jgi:hypothetical protein